ncbi:MAG: FAD-dependent oxidoreductase [Ignavibacteriaceae bacterium]|nr:FAD-dependent oxidoreductase [Ignavibacteriaceae bacterium]
MKTDKTYDYIIYSASLSGVLTAIDLSKKGNSVLLLNFYGFMGGSITESLNCHQVIDEESLNGSAKTLFEKIKETKHAILNQSGNEFILNPETIKIILQEEIENSNIDLLFHIVPFYLKQREDYVEFSVTGKEGIFQIKGKTIVDASDEFDLLKLENVKRSLKEIYYNLFLTVLKDDKWQSFELINTLKKLDDNRYWVSLSIPKPDNDFFIENASQKILNQFEEVVQKSEGRVQLVAPQSQRIYEVDRLVISESVFHVKSKLSNLFSMQAKFKELSELRIGLKNN